jgi:hypothetical protein
MKEQVMGSIPGRYRRKESRSPTATACSSEIVAATTADRSLRSEAEVFVGYRTTRSTSTLLLKPIYILMEEILVELRC